VIKDRDLITVGISPSWDVVCFADGIEWGQHTNLKSQHIIPAGKALNISQALAWTGQGNIAAGLWGKNDYVQLMQSISSVQKLIDVKFTQVPNQIRHNVTLIDEKNHREMHIKGSSELANPESLAQLEKDLENIVSTNSCIVLAGALPENDLLLNQIIRIVEMTASKGAKIVVDTHGFALKKLIDTKKIYAIHSNIEELSELLECQIENTEQAIIQHTKKLLNDVEILLVSSGQKGAMAITKDLAYSAICITSKTVNCTVGCGDYLLAGFLGQLQKTNDMGKALENAIRLATAKAWNITDKKWDDVKKIIEVKTKQL
jgi:1-phosphofructokinase